MSQKVKICDILSQDDEYRGWFYLPPEPWSLETEGIFVEDDKDVEPGSDAHIPDIIKSEGWKVTLDEAGIEDVIFNAEAQIEDPTLEDLFSAFKFYLENDAFKEF